MYERIELMSEFQSLCLFQHFLSHNKQRAFSYPNLSLSLSLCVKILPAKKWRSEISLISPHRRRFSAVHLR